MCLLDVCSKWSADVDNSISLPTYRCQTEITPSKIKRSIDYKKHGNEGTRTNG